MTKRPEAAHPPLVSNSPLHPETLAGSWKRDETLQGRNSLIPRHRLSQPLPHTLPPKNSRRSPD